MKTLNLRQLKLEELDVKELQKIEGGGFAHDVGTGLRFLWVGLTRGTTEAIVDYARNEVLCDCD
ncbi:MAG: bacteriocin [archaeon]|nr:bacteriocin [archaeon]